MVVHDERWKRNAWSIRGSKASSPTVEKWRAADFHYTDASSSPATRCSYSANSPPPVIVSEHDVEFQVGQLIAAGRGHAGAAQALRSGREAIQRAEWELVGDSARREVEAEREKSPQPQNIAQSPRRAPVHQAPKQAAAGKDLTIWAWIHLSCFLPAPRCWPPGLRSERYGGFFLGVRAKPGLYVHVRDFLLFEMQHTGLVKPNALCDDRIGKLLDADVLTLTLSL